MNIKHFVKNCLISLLVTILLSCATTGNGSSSSLQEAIEQSAEKIANDIPAESIIAVVAFESNNDYLSDYIIGELNGALFDRGITVVTRRSLEYAQRELNFQMSGDVSDETAKSTGKLFGADLIVVGELRDVGGTYRYRVDAIHVEEAKHGSTVRLDVQNDRSTWRMISTLAKQQPTEKAPRYGITEQTIPDSPLTFLERGILLAMRGEYDIAIMDFTEVLKLNPNLVSAYILRGRALYASISLTGDVGENFSKVEIWGLYIFSDNKGVPDVSDRALEDFTQAIKLDPNNVIAYYERGTVHKLKEDFDLALKDFTQAIRLDPNNATLYSSRSNVFSSMGEFDRAREDDNQVIKIYTQAIQLNPNDDKAYINRGNFFSYQGDYDQAVEDYTQAINICTRTKKHNPNNEEAYRRRGLAYENKGDHNRAIKDYTQAIKLKPDNLTAFIWRGYAYSEKGNYDRAIKDFTQVIRLDLGDTWSYSRRGAAYYKKGDFDHAIEDYSRSIRLNPKVAEQVYFDLISHDENDHLIEILTQLIKLNPNVSGLYSGRGLEHRQKGENDQAIADFTQVIKLDPNDGFAYMSRGHAYFDKGDYDLAIEDYTQLIRFYPDDAFHYNMRGHAYYSKGNHDQAIEDFTKAIKFSDSKHLNINGASYYNNRGNVYFIKGDYDRAVTDYEAALRLNPDDGVIRQNLDDARRLRGIGER